MAAAGVNRLQSGARPAHHRCTGCVAGGMTLVSMNAGKAGSAHGRGQALRCLVEV